MVDSDLFCRLGSRAHAIGYADSVECVAGKRESRQLLAQVLDARNALQMSGRRLRHAASPTIQAHGTRFGLDADDFAQFAADG